MSLTFVTLNTDTNITEVFHTTDNKNFDGRNIDWRLTRLMGNSVPLTGDESFKGESFTICNSQVMLGGNPIAFNPKYNYKLFNEKRYIYIATASGELYKISKDKLHAYKPKEEIRALHDDNIYCFIANKLFQVIDDNTHVCVHEYDMLIIGLFSCAKGIIVYTNNGVYCNDKLIVEHNNISVYDFHVNDKYISLYDKLYTIDGELIATFDGDIIMRLVDEYALVALSRVYYIPERKVVHTGEGLILPYYTAHN